MKIKTIILSMAVGIFAFLSAQADQEAWESEVFDVNYKITNNSDDYVLRVEFLNLKGKRVKRELEDVKSHSSKKGEIKSYSGHASYEVYLVDPSNGTTVLLAGSGIGPTRFTGQIEGVGAEATLKNSNLTTSLSNKYDKHSKTAKFEYSLDKSSEKKENNKK